MQKVKEKRSTDKLFGEIPSLVKLRYMVTLIFLLSTISFILVFVTEFFVPASLILISYILVFVLMVKLFMIKKI